MEIRALRFRVGARTCLGALYSPAARGRFPAVLSLHGFPGVQKNDDIAAELCRRGFVVFIPYFGGSWGSDGPYTIAGLHEDAAAARRLLLRMRHVDKDRAGLLGLSVGGWVALRLAAEQKFGAVAVMAPAVPKGGVGDRQLIRLNRRVLDIPDAAELMDEYLREVRKDQPKDYIPRIAPSPLLFLQGRRDGVILPESTRQLVALAVGPHEYRELPDEEHEFQHDRPAVIDAVSTFFEKHLHPSATRWHVGSDRTPA